MPDRIPPLPVAPGVLPQNPQATSGQAGAGERPQASALPAPPEGLPRRPAIEDVRSRGPHRIPPASRIAADHQWGVELSDALKRYVVARTNQAAAYLTHFERDDYARWRGACLGQAHLWMRLDAANPAAPATDRLDALASFDGAVHATLHQRSYSHEREQGFSIGRMLGVDAWSAKPGTHDAVYTRTMNDLHGIGSHVHSHRGLRLAELPQAMCEINGYAIAEVDLPGRRGARHPWALSRTNPDEVRIFDWPSTQRDGNAAPSTLTRRRGRPGPVERAE